MSNNIVDSLFDKIKEISITYDQWLTEDDKLHVDAMYNDWMEENKESSTDTKEGKQK